MLCQSLQSEPLVCFNPDMNIPQVVLQSEPLVCFNPDMNIPQVVLYCKCKRHKADFKCWAVFGKEEENTPVCDEACFLVIYSFELVLLYFL